MISTDGFFRADFRISDEAQEADKCELILRLVDFPAEKGHTSAIFLRFAQQFESIVGGASRSAQDADNEMGIVVD